MTKTKETDTQRLPAAVQEFIDTATLPPQQIKREQLSEQMPQLRKAAMDELQRHYGTFKLRMPSVSKPRPVKRDGDDYWAALQEAAEAAAAALRASIGGEPHIPVTLRSPAVHYTEAMKTLRLIRWLAVAVLARDYGWTRDRLRRHLAMADLLPDTGQQADTDADPSTLPDWDQDEARYAEQDAVQWMQVAHRELSVREEADAKAWAAFCDKARAAARESLAEVQANVEQIADPVLRLMAYASVANTAWSKSKQVDALINARRMGIMVLFHDYEWKPARIQQFLDQAGERDQRFVQTALKNPDERQRPAWGAATAAHRAKLAHEEFVAREDASEWAVPRRNQLMIELSEGRWERGRRLSDAEMEQGRGRVWSNGELSRLAKMSTAAVSGIRTNRAVAAA